MPNSDNISISAENQLIIYDKISKEFNILIDSIRYYSWSSDGKSILYTKDSDTDTIIYKYDVDSDISEPFFDGVAPQYSIGDKYIAYYESGSHRTVLFVREVSTGKEIKFKQNAIYYFKFSPNGEQIALVQESAKHLKDCEMVVWDFNTGKTCTVIERITSGYYFDWK